jgi:hypothetical protein
VRIAEYLFTSICLYLYLQLREHPQDALAHNALAHDALNLPLLTPHARGGGRGGGGGEEGGEGGGGGGGVSPAAGARTHAQRARAEEEETEASGNTTLRYAGVSRSLLTCTRSLYDM